jgi:hypothetical protein
MQIYEKLSTPTNFHTLFFHNPFNTPQHFFILPPKLLNHTMAAVESLQALIKHLSFHSLSLPHLEIDFNVARRLDGAGWDRRLADHNTLSREGGTKLGGVHALHGHRTSKKSTRIGDIDFIFNDVLPFFKAVDIAVGSGIANSDIIA